MTTLCKTPYCELGKDKIKLETDLYVKQLYKDPLEGVFHMYSGHECAMNCSSSWKFSPHYSDSLKRYCPPNVSIVTKEDLCILIEKGCCR